MGWNSVREMFAPEPPPPPTSSTDRVQARMSQAINSMRSNPSHTATQRMEAATGGVVALPAADSCFPSLTFKQRVQGCLSCAATGMAFSFMGFLLWWTGNIRGFAFTYTLGNIISICGTGFLFGPKRQCRSMFAAKRIWATSIYVTAMLLTLIVAFSRGPKMLVFLLLFIQW